MKVKHRRYNKGTASLLVLGATQNLDQKSVNGRQWYFQGCIPDLRGLRLHDRDLAKKMEESRAKVDARLTANGESLNKIIRGGAFHKLYDTTGGYVIRLAGTC